jgi:hypothetical protein
MDGSSQMRSSLILSILHNRKHIGSEPFWGVRVAVAEALSDAPSNTAADILVRVV